MNKCFSTLRGVAQSSEELLADQYRFVESTEIKYSASVLRSSIQPCLEEIEKSTLLLKTHLEICIDNLNVAQDVWQSKQRIANTPSIQSLDRIGKVIGSWNRFQQQENDFQRIITGQAQQIWLQHIEKLEDKTFLDSKTKQYRADINRNDKTLFNRELPSIFNAVSEEINQSAKKLFLETYQDWNWERFNPEQSLLETIEKSAKLKFNAEHDRLRANVSERFNGLSSYGFYLSLYQSVQDTIERWRKRPGSISRQEIQDFKRIVLDKIEDRITLKFGERLEAVKELSEHTISFYNDFLARQQRYQQETPQQQKAEQGWITQQRQQLEKLLAELECLQSN